MGKTMRAIGLMSGTSMDGIDVAMIDTDGESRLERGPALTIAYDEEFRASLQRAISEAQHLADRTGRPGCLAEVERELTRQNAAAVERFLAEGRLTPGAVDVVGFHGHTVLHAPDRRLTVQLGDGPGLAAAIGIDVVYDLRAADCAAGGQGAPLAPVYHRALAASLPQRPIAVLNIGGVANVTWIGRSGELISFDTGPGNALIDDWMQRRLGFPRDEHGSLAAKGRVHDDYVTQYLRHSYFGAPPPKSLDRNAFPLGLVHSLSHEDGAATLTAFTAASIARAREHFPEQPQLWVVSGGGRLNKTLMSMLAGHVEGAVAPAEAAGMDGDAVEAEAWAYLAVRSLKGLPVSFPGTTGVPMPLTGGVLAKKGRLAKT
ncbi:MAG: anhydro-N-acetylmuramic acid kinase [Hyphomicrobiaceae bacterium]